MPGSLSEPMQGIRMRKPFVNRSFSVMTAAVAAVLAPAACLPETATAPFRDQLAAMEAEIGGVIGVHAANIATGETLGHRADERFAFASTFKPLLVAAVLADADAGRLSLGRRLSLEGIEIQPHSPIVGALGSGERPRVETLCEAAITISDNTATNLLLDLVGGPAGLTRFLRAHGDDVTRLDRYEVALNTNLDGDVRDTSTPRAMSGSYARFVFGDALSAASRQRLEQWLVSSRTGGKRLRAGLPAAWRSGDKTGYGANGAVNDVAIAWPAGGGPIVITVFMSGSGEDVATLNAVHARIAGLVAERLAGG